MELPPLRERREDIGALAQHYLSHFERRQGRPRLCFSARCANAIARHAWPGNLRELRNAVERAVILSPASQLEPQDLGLDANVTLNGTETGPLAADGAAALRFDPPPRRWAKTL